MEVNPRLDYRKWYEEALLKVTALKNKSSLLSWLRLFIFLAFIASFISAFAYNVVLIYPALMLLAAFICLLVYHEKVNFKIRFHETYSQCLNDELSALEYKFPFESGNKYIDPEHPYTWDLDIFGKNSIFSSLNRTSTTRGSKKLADNFINPSLENETIREKQEAVRELSGMHQWLLNFRAYGILGTSSENSEREVIDWAAAKPYFSSLSFALLIYLIPGISLGMTILVALGGISVNSFILYMFIPLGISGMFASRITKRHNQVSRKSAMLTNYASRLRMTETMAFSSPHLTGIQNNLGKGNATASAAIKKLSRIISSMDARLNWLMWIILNFLLLWDLRQMRRLELWQKEHKQQLNQWFEALATIEALGSLAGYAILNPLFTYPDPTDKLLAIKAVDAGHPLIPPDRRIDNTIDITGKGTFNIITGANMAGKSTYLRTVGINLVLAMTGAPVCAAEFLFFPAIPYTSLHTLDSLSTNKSYFFAELERLKLIIDTLNRGLNIYVFLDEILKGTNSYDKQNGSKALLRQLVTLGASGMIATHDLDLGQLEQSFPENITNYCFEAVIINNELYFDYKLNQGIAKNMNATFLMKHMGITV